MILVKLYLILGIGFVIYQLREYLDIYRFLKTGVIPQRVIDEGDADAIQEFRDMEQNVNGVLSRFGPVGQNVLFGLTYTYLILRDWLTWLYQLYKMYRDR